MGNLLQCLSTSHVKKIFLMFKWNFMSFIWYSLPLFLSLGITGYLKRIYLYLLYFPSSPQVMRHWNSAQRRWGCLMMEQGQVGQGLKQLDLVKDVPGVGKGVGLDDL